ncbi:thiamine transporter [Amphibacillus marinus]|uniref:Thiamine transporter n=1 Tax=Amphibacillus marinus TaxID=872970 RepID=A0A1H8N6D0_9BACI|nr:energy-coupled thiamine transporter ThiT [Amphibacillus marinus]SEO25048.1 thiamine transporter [Amphibacillus marinus]
METKRTLFLIEVAIFSALALVLDLLPLSFKVWGQGGSVSFAMIPIFIVAFRWGLKGGLLAGLLYSILQMAIGDAYIVHWAQALLDYPIAFTVLGLAGLFAPAVQAALKADNISKFIMLVSAGVFVGTSFRFIAHYAAGIVFFAAFSGDMNPWLYSLVYNGSFLLPSAIINIVAVSFLFNKRPKLVAVAA